MTAEQFLDCVWQLTGAAPGTFDAPILRGKIDEAGGEAIELNGEWIWGALPEDATQSPAGEQLVFRKIVKLPAPVAKGVAVMSADNEFDLYIGRRLVASSKDWTKVQTISMSGRLKKGDNELIIVARNAGSSPNPAGLYFESRLSLQDGSELEIVTDSSWSYSNEKVPGGREGRLGLPKGPWQKIESRGSTGVYKPIRAGAKRGLALGSAGTDLMVRASLLKSDFLMRSLGRPNRDQIVTSRPSELNTLEAIDLSNGGSVSKALAVGAHELIESNRTSDQLVHDLYLAALSREPTSEELTIILEAIGEKPKATAIEDLLWAICMMPEFLMIR
jgi:hypothetical protein